MSVLLVCTTKRDRADIVSAMLFDLGASAVGEHDLDRSDGRDSDMVELRAGFGSNGDALRAMSAITDIGTSSIETTEQQWVENQRDGLSPVEVGPWRIRAPWHPPFPDVGDENAIEIVIDPGAAFGHGAHPSTSLILALLPHLVGAGDNVLDIGTGTGILAIASAKLGATATAVDNSPVAIGMAIANSAGNDVTGRVAIELMDAAEIDVGEADLALVNVTLEAHRHIAPALTDVPMIVVSGILDSQVDETAELYGAHDVDRTFTYGEWSALVLSRSALRQLD